MSLTQEILRHHILATPVGEIALVWSAYRNGGRVHRVLLSAEGIPAGSMVPARFPESLAGSCPEIDNLCMELSAFLRGDPVRVSLTHIAVDQCSLFQQSVLLVEYDIPRGSVSTYRRIASHLGKPRSSRAVGNALARNPFPIIIPCHRAIRSDLTLGGFQGGLSMKRRLLEMEGVRFDPAGRVIPDPMYY